MINTNPVKTKCPDVTIVIVNYNTSDLLKKCLDSIFEFERDLKLEIIVIDNNSPEDNFDEVVAGFDNLVIIKNEKNLGFGRANNQGINQAKGKYILLLNNDTYLIDNSISKLIEFLSDKNEEMIVAPRLLNDDGSTQLSVCDFPGFRESFTSNFFIYKIFPKSKYFNKYHLLNKGLDYSSEVDYVSGAFMLARNEVFKKLNGFDERFFFYFEEIDMCYRLKKSGGKVFYCPITNVYHVGGGTTNKYSFFKYSNQSISTIKFYQKHFSGIKFFGCLLNHYAGILIRVPMFFMGSLIKKDLFSRALIYSKLLGVYPKNQFKKNPD